MGKRSPVFLRFATPMNRLLRDIEVKSTMISHHTTCATQDDVMLWHGLSITHLMCRPAKTPLCTRVRSVHAVEVAGLKEFPSGPIDDIVGSVELDELEAGVGPADPASLELTLRDGMVGGGNIEVRVASELTDRSEYWYVCTDYPSPLLRLPIETDFGGLDRPRSSPLLVCDRHACGPCARACWGLG
jgi:hypothetical protein